MADALASGASVRKDVGVQVPPRPLQPRTGAVGEVALRSPNVDEPVALCRNAVAATIRPEPLEVIVDVSLTVSGKVDTSACRRVAGNLSCCRTGNSTSSRSGYSWHR